MHGIGKRSQLPYLNTLSGNGGIDYLYGEGGADLLYGGAGGDNLHEGEGDDALVGDDPEGVGDDQFDGGMGNDTFEGGAGLDMLDVANQARADYASIDHTVVDLAAGFAQIYSSTGLMETDTLNEIANVLGSEKKDVVFGDAGNNAIFGHGGDDALHGGLGADTLDSGVGNDTLSGGDGVDRFVTSGGGLSAETKTVSDFGFGGQERLDIADLFITGLDQLDIVQVGQDTHILAQDVTIILSNFTRQMTASDFIFSPEI